jgi:hypothetical protein
MWEQLRIFERTHDSHTINIISISNVSVFDSVISCNIIYQKYISHKEKDDLAIYKTEFGFVARKENDFAHGETEQEAIFDLIFKLSDRDTSKYIGIDIKEKRKTLLREIKFLVAVYSHSLQFY